MRIAKSGFALIALLWPLALSAAETTHDKEETLFHVVRLRIDGTENDEGGFVTWNGYGAIGGDREKFVARTEGEMQNGHAERSEVWGLYSRNISDFWDLQAGLRQDFDPRPETWLVLGVEGLAPYFVETEAHLFLSKRGDLAARIEPSIDLPVTQDLILTPHLKLDMAASDAPGSGIGKGLSRVEAGARLRYEIVRKFAPYLDLVYERALGNTARMVREEGGDPGELTLRAGIALWF